MGWIETDIFCEKCQKQSKLKVISVGHQDFYTCDECFSKKPQNLYGNALPINKEAEIKFKAYSVLLPPVFLSKQAHDGMMKAFKNSQKKKKKGK